MLNHSPQPATPEAQALLRVAEQDWKTVELLAQHPDAPTSSICFHAQQYLEKVMKAVLVSSAVTLRYGEVDFALLDVPTVLGMMKNARIWVEEHIE
ncbi:MAG: HEPN domain-containing protein [Anaerolineae bacterium]|nr:HEPN domain-containing protein [Anaerolineae bacterium]